MNASRQRILISSVLSGGLLLIIALLYTAGCKQRVVDQEFSVNASVLDSMYGHAGELVFNQTAVQCRACHGDVYEAWKGSHHALANRPMVRDQDALPFHARRVTPANGVTSEVSSVDGGYQVLTMGRSNTNELFEPTMAIGLDPLVQYLVPFEGGRFQTLSLSYDPKNNVWFDVFGGEKRMGHEWGFWANQGMNWNAQCAFCHMTGFKKGYDDESDTYNSTWEDMGISCSQCHGDLSGHPSPDLVAGQPESSEKYKVGMESCAVCHARREQLTDDYKPGEKFGDHFRLTLPSNPALYHPSGKLIEEVYVYGSFLMNRMSHAGVTCMDCHDPHTNELKYPASNNTLCMSCHAPPGKNGAIPIVPTEHSHHGVESKGNVCIDCHMPHDTFMQVDPRRDHGFLHPDPVLTRDLGIPNACANCHGDQSNDWLVEAVDEWYGTNMNATVRTRTRAVAAVQQQEPDAWVDLLAIAKEEVIPIWRASCVELLAAHLNQPGVASFIEQELKHENELVRGAAVRAFTDVEYFRPVVRPLLKDPVRSVRLAAAAAIAEVLPEQHEAMQELNTYLKLNSDQPQGLVTRAQMALRKGRSEEGLTFLKKAIQMDGGSPYIHYLKGMTQHQLGQFDDAATSILDAIERAPDNIDYRYALALLSGEVNDLPQAITQFEEILKLNPSLARVRYNLGLAYAQQEKLPEAIDAVTRSIATEPSADAYYALATLYDRQGDGRLAQEAARNALALDPSHQLSINFLRTRK